MIMDKIKEMRNKFRVSQHRLALISGIGRYRISMAEIGYLILRDSEIRALETALALIEKQQAEALK